MSPRWTAEVADCSMPITFDQHSNCSFKCIYCFASYQRALGSGKTSYFANQFNAVDVKRVKRIFTEPDFKPQFWAYIKDRKTIQWGGMSDPFCDFERHTPTGLELLRFFRKIDYPICFSTKGTWWLDDPRYTELFKDNPNWNVKISIITLDEDKAKRIEIGVDSPQKRLEALQKVAKLNCGGATLRLRPFIIGVSSPRHTQLIDYAAEMGASALSTEFFCLEIRSKILRRRLKILDELCGFDVFAFYKKYSSGQGYLRLNRNVKRRFIDDMESACRRNKIRFYVSDAHFKERCANGSCCGLPESFNYSRGQFCEALVICKAKGKVSFQDIAPAMQHLKAVPYEKAEGFNTCSCERRVMFQGKTFFDYMRWLWNNPNKSGQSPYRLFEGIMNPTGFDENQDLIYTYDRSRE
jgi:DNA repair photolyase